MTIQDVSKKTGLSVATISRVMNNDSRVSDKTRKIVNKAIAEMGYVPNLLGRNLRKIKTDIIYVLLPTIDNSFYSKIVVGIEEEAKKNNYNIMLCITENSPAAYSKYIEFVRNKLADGIIIISPATRDMFPDLDNIPAVICCESDSRYNCVQVDIDNERAAYDAVTHLIKKGKKDILLIGGEYTSGRLREKGYLSALSDAGIKPRSELILKNNYSYNDGRNAIISFFEKGLRADGVFAVSDELAIGVLRGLERLGKKVPAEVSVIGFDNITYARINNPPVSTIMQPRLDMGRLSFKLLYDIMNNNCVKTERTLLPYKLIERFSTTGVRDDEEQY